MRYEKGRKEQTRKRIVDVASARFRARGIEATGVAGLMADAGLTHGGFYAHFGSKDDLVRAAIAEAHARSRETWTKEVQAAKERGQDGLEVIVRRYLRTAHRDRPEAGCAVAALAQEVARDDRQTRDVMAHVADDMAAIIASELPATMPEEKARDTAYAIFALLIGTLQLARVTTDKAVSQSILQSGQDAALHLARQWA
jgi:TetR/AcrR family transcriptional regulator, transcriptional repressor for nem operon